ncbi:MAG: family 2 glycosyl transferase [Bacteroidetes bacterium]|jgi:cellulose synthase/poly-beta-1,6-N-acetylglucosamine synthase-like glycosyltransferase|nr:family 2 glycosyl transferase [Bacteroidota bacterium]
MKQNYSSSKIIRVNPPKKTDVYTIRTLICLGLICMSVFVAWFINPEHIGYAPIFWLLTFALLFKLLKMIHEWYHYWNVSVPVAPEMTRKWTVDVLTTSCPGEPRDMIIRTLQAMTKIKYPHTNYLCDEGNDPVLKKICEELGVVHVTREIKTDAKAGNINNALKQATGEICIVLDPDHEPIPEFIDRVLPYFEDDGIGYVQSVQAYGNQSESIIARGAAEQTYHFYGPMMMCMNSYGTVQAIGANCAFRRKALDSIGGHAAGLSEDMHTAMQLHAKGWRSLYIPEILTRGLVPGTLSGYYKQQLKWSRGTFELLFRTYPQLYKNFTWRQKLHYLTIPLYFLFGLVNLIDILIPSIALGFAEVPWEVDLSQFALYFFPLCALSMLIRLYAQRWLLEKHERGFHLAGGILRTATWWIFLIGFIYTIFKIKVPYIPTPKEDEHQNYWKLSIPNLFISLVSISIIIYGLSIDWSPYSFAMAFYALINGLILGCIVVLSQQKMLDSFKEKIKQLPSLNYIVNFGSGILNKIEGLIYNMFRIGPVALLVAVSLVFLSYRTIDHEETSTSADQRETGGFYKGVSLNEEKNLNEALISGRRAGAGDVISFIHKWDTTVTFPTQLFSEIKKSEMVPLVQWQMGDENKKDLNGLFHKIALGEYDSYLQKMAVNIRNFQSPLFLSFAHGTSKSESDASLYIKASQYIHGFFDRAGIYNITWIWCPSSPNDYDLYPGSEYVDWIGISCLNYGKDIQSKQVSSFSDLYSQFRNKYLSLDKPVMITEFGASTETAQKEWFLESLKNISSEFREIKSVVFFNSKKNVLSFSDDPGKDFSTTTDFKFRDNSVAEAISSELMKEPFNLKPFSVSQSSLYSVNTHSSSYNGITGTPGNYSMLINGKPFYIKGIAYNTSHDWRDGNTPLTRRQVEKDFEKIKAMGANTIRRYDYGIYDKNILNIAKEYDLKVLYGFWFDPKVDYYKDSAKVKEYLHSVEEKVLEYKDQPSVLAWSVGNETWGLLKHSYSKPYLIKVRSHYVKFIELLAKRIHELDPTRPVFTCMEHHKNQTEGEIAALRDEAPSIDVIGINSYYKEQIGRLNELTWKFDSLRPYLVSEFGPNGYWNSEFNRTNKGSLVEQNENEKAEWYKWQWNNYIAAFKGCNVGGFAYCWHDRMEGTNTWFGLTDFKGRIKPSYYALKEVWTGKKSQALPEIFIKAPSSITPGHEYTFTVEGDVDGMDDLTYEWYLHKNECLDRVKNVEPVNEGSSVKVKIPEEPSDYRLYIYVSNDEGKVTTASVPVKVGENKK